MTTFRVVPFKLKSGLLSSIEHSMTSYKLSRNKRYISPKMLFRKRSRLQWGSRDFRHNKCLFLFFLTKNMRQPLSLLQNRGHGRQQKRAASHSRKRTIYFLVTDSSVIETQSVSWTCICGHIFRRRQKNKQSPRHAGLKLSVQRR